MQAFHSTSGTKEAAFCLGSNLGDRLALLREARDRLCRTPGARLLTQSPVYETEPVGVRPEYRDLKYLNAVLVFEAALTGPNWMTWASDIEAAMGRVRGADKFAPRGMDIDLLYCGDETRNTNALQLPHPRWASRLFVVRPLADVRPDLVLPGAAGPVSGLLPALEAGTEKVAVFAPVW